MLQIKNPIAFDTETFYTTEYSLKKMSVFAYCNDMRFNCYMVSAYEPGFAFAGAPKDFDWSRLHNRTVLAHNAMFDSLVFERMQKDGKIPAHVKPHNWLCTADMTAYLRVKRSLDVACQFLLNTDISKDVRDKMRGKVRDDLPLDTPLRKDLLIYAERDARMCYELYDKHGAEWPGSEKEISIESRESMFTGIPVNLPEVNRHIDRLQTDLHSAEKDIPWDWDPTKTPLAAALIREYCRDKGLWCPASFAKTSAECMQWEDEYSGTYPWIKAVRDYRRINMILQKLITMRDHTMGNGYMRYALKYFGATTGRWSGAEGYNVQNLPRETLYDVNLRNLLVAPVGHTLLIADYAQIEARILLWLVGDEPMLELIRAGINIYEAHARKTMGWVGGDLKKEDPKSYQLAKARVLGLGFSCSWKKFKILAKTYGIELTDQESEATVNDFRSKNPLIVNFWRVAGRGISYSAIRNDPSYSFTLKSGRKLSYYEPKRIEAMGGHYAQYTRGMPAKKLYGGLVVENIVQATARDILVDGWLKCRAAGLPVYFTCHDEIVSSAPVEDAEKTRQAMLDILQTPPAWAQGLPLGAEIIESPIYRK